MYYPFFRARQFELIALRELANEGATQGIIVPILEPLKEAHNNLDLAYKVFREKEQKSYLIMNPVDGEVTGDGVHYLDYLSTLDKGTYLPAFRYGLNGAYIIGCVQKYALENCLIICHNNVIADSDDFKRLAELEEVNAFVVEDPGRNRSLNRYLQNLNKTYIRLDDPFVRQVRNSDYLSITEHLFTEEHLFFQEDKFDGFSDYTVLPSDFVEGGSTPRAVVIHLTYLNEKGEIWIRHFTSITNDSIANVQGKFAEAAKKAVLFCRSKRLTNSALEELYGYFDEQHYPGLGTVKKISMKNHLLIISQYLRGR